MYTHKYPGLKQWCKIAIERGYTHILAGDGTKTALADVVSGKAKTPRAPANCFWAGDGASSDRVVLYSSNTGKRLGHYEFVNDNPTPAYPKVAGFDVTPGQQLALF